MPTEIVTTEVWKERNAFFSAELKRVTDEIEEDNSRGESQIDWQTRYDMVKQAMYLTDTLDSINHRMRDEQNENRDRWLRHRMEEIAKSIPTVVAVDGESLPPNIVPIIQAAIQIKELAAEIGMVDL